MHIFSMDNKYICNIQVGKCSNFQDICFVSVKILQPLTLNMNCTQPFLSLHVVLQRKTLGPGSHVDANLCKVSAQTKPSQQVHTPMTLVSQQEACATKSLTSLNKSLMSPPGFEKIPQKFLVECFRQGDFLWKAQSRMRKRLCSPCTPKRGCIKDVSARYRKKTKRKHTMQTILAIRVPT